MPWRYAATLTYVCLWQRVRRLSDYAYHWCDVEGYTKIYLTIFNINKNFPLWGAIKHNAGWISLVGVNKQSSRFYRVDKETQSHSQIYFPLALLRYWIRLLSCLQFVTISGLKISGWTSQWRHNERDGVLNHRRLDCLLNRLFRRRSKKTSKLCVTGLCGGNSQVTGGFPSQMG